MAREIFIDSGAWVGLVDRSDTFHIEATTAYSTLLQRWPTWVTTNLIIAETYTLIRYRAGHKFALQFLARVHAAARLIIIYADADIQTDAEAILRRYADQDFSYTDAVSFAVMRRRGMADAFAFDRHFRTAGFALVPGPPQ